MYTDKYTEITDANMIQQAWHTLPSAFFSSTYTKIESVALKRGWGPEPPLANSGREKKK